jgi:hypothetical protein
MNVKGKGKSIPFINIRISGCKLCPPFQLMNKLTDILEPSYELFAVGGHPNRMLFLYPVQSVITIWRAPELP